MVTFCQTCFDIPIPIPATKSVLLDFPILYPNTIPYLELLWKPYRPCDWFRKHTTKPMPVLELTPYKSWNLYLPVLKLIPISQMMIPSWVLILLPYLFGPKHSTCTSRSHGTVQSRGFAFCSCLSHRGLLQCFKLFNSDDLTAFVCCVGWSLIWTPIAKNLSGCVELDNPRNRRKIWNFIRRITLSGLEIVML